MVLCSLRLFSREVFRFFIFFSFSRRETITMRIYIPWLIAATVTNVVAVAIPDPAVAVTQKQGMPLPFSQLTNNKTKRPPLSPPLQKVLTNIPINRNRPQNPRPSRRRPSPRHPPLSTQNASSQTRKNTQRPLQNSRHDRCWFPLRR